MKKYDRETVGRDTVGRRACWVRCFAILVLTFPVLSCEKHESTSSDSKRRKPGGSTVEKVIQPNGQLGGSDETAENSDRKDSVLVETDWEKRLNAEILAVASEAEINDDPAAYRRSISHLRESLKDRSMEEISTMAELLRDPSTATLSRYVMLTATLAEMAEWDPEMALQFMTGKLSAETRDNLGVASFVMPEIARKDPALLTAWLSTAVSSTNKATVDLTEGIKALAAVSSESAFALRAYPSRRNAFVILILIVISILWGGGDYDYDYDYD